MKRRRTKVSIKRASDPNFVMVEVDNPDYQPQHAGASGNPRKSPATFNLRESYVGELAARRVITEGEKRAADRIRAAYEAMGGAGAGAIDYERVRVDGGQIAQTVTDRQLNASRTMRESINALGPQGHDLVIQIAGQGRRPVEFSRVKGRQDYISQRFRECLETLAEHWGYQSRRTIKGLTSS